MKRVLFLIPMMLTGCFGVPCSYLESSRAFEEGALPRYEAYLRADTALSATEREALLIEVEARRRATAEAKELCDGWFFGLFGGE